MQLSTIALLIKKNEHNPNHKVDSREIANSFEALFPYFLSLSHMYPIVMCERKMMMMQDRQIMHVLRV
jgi:hypothetical protein